MAAKKGGGELIPQQMAGISTIQNVLPNLTETVLSYTDDQLSALIEQSKALGWVGMRCMLAAEYEGHRRIINRVAEENKSLPPDQKVKAEDHVRELAATWGIEKRTLEADQRLHRVFFVPRQFDGKPDASEEERKEFAENEKTSLFETEQAADYLHSKHYLTIAVRAEKQGRAREALLMLAKRKEENGGFLTTRGADDAMREFLGLNGERTKPEPAESEDTIPQITGDVMAYVASLKQAASMVDDSGFPAYVFRMGEAQQWVASVNPPADVTDEEGDTVPAPRTMIVPTKTGPRVLQFGEDYDPEEVDEFEAEEAEEAEEVPAPTPLPVPKDSEVEGAPDVELAGDPDLIQVFDEE